MKKIIFCAIIFCMPFFLFSQQEAFNYYEINNAVFKNIPYKIGLDQNAKTIELFEINLPNIEVDNVNLMTSSVIYEITFKDNSKVFVVGDISKEDVDLKRQVNFNRKNIEKTIDKKSLEDIIYAEKCKIWIKDLHPKDGLKIKKNRFNALVKKDGFIIFYFNVRKKDLEKFNESINSLKIM